MNALKIDTTVDETIATAMPGLRPLLGRRVELIALESDTPQKASSAKAKGGVLGLFADEPELMDKVVEWAIEARQRRPLRSKRA